MKRPNEKTEEELKVLGQLFTIKHHRPSFTVEGYDCSFNQSY